MKPLVILFASLIGLVQAHESPDHSLKQLNEDIDDKPTPELLFKRAMAYKALGKINKASADLESATKALPTHIPWHIERSRVELTANRPTEALLIANKALKLAQHGQERAEIHILRAQTYLHTGKYKPSLHACQLAFKEVPAGKLDWFLLRSENQRQLGQHEQRAQDLQAGLKRFPNTILKSHWVDALIDAGKNIEALVHIDKELPTLRWKSHWQIKQARSLIGLNRKIESESILREALEEINSRLNPSQPDILLLADKTHILILTGKKREAQHTLNTLRKHRAPLTSTRMLESLIKNM